MRSLDHLNPKAEQHPRHHQSVTSRSFFGRTQIHPSRSLDQRPHSRSHTQGRIAWSTITGEYDETADAYVFGHSPRPAYFDQIASAPAGPWAAAVEFAILSCIETVARKTTAFPAIQPARHLGYFE